MPQSLSSWGQAKFTTSVSKMLLTVDSDISDIGYPIGYSVGFVPICSFLVPLVPSRSPKDFMWQVHILCAHYLIQFSLALLDTKATNEGDEQPTDKAAQDKGKEEGQVIGEAEVVEDAAGTSGDPLGAVGGNIEVQDKEEEEDDDNEEEDEEEDEDDPDVDEEEYMKQINKQRKVSKVSSGSVLGEGVTKQVTNVYTLRVTLQKREQPG